MPSVSTDRGVLCCLTALTGGAAAPKMGWFRRSQRSSAEWSRDSSRRSASQARRPGSSVATCSRCWAGGPSWLPRTQVVAKYSVSAGTGKSAGAEAGSHAAQRREVRRRGASASTTDAVASVGKICHGGDVAIEAGEHLQSPFRGLSKLPRFAHISPPDVPDRCHVLARRCLGQLPRFSCHGGRVCHGRGVQGTCWRGCWWPHCSDRRDGQFSRG